MASWIHAAVRARRQWGPWSLRTFVVAIAVACFALTLASYGFARPGGGQTYGGGSRSSGSSGSGSRSSGSTSGSRSSSGTSSFGSRSSSSTSSGSSTSSSSTSSGASYPSSHGGGTYTPNGSLSVELVIVMLIIGGAMVIWFGYRAYIKSNEQEWTSSPPVPEYYPRVEAPNKEEIPARRKLTALAKYDPNFSVPLFEDFLYALYAAAQEARGAGKLDSLAAYLSSSARSSFHSGVKPSEVKGIVVGALHIEKVGARKGTPPKATVQVVFEVNFTEVVKSGGSNAERTIYARERWSLARARDVVSRTPDKARIVNCPNCGAPLSDQKGNTCSYCNKTVDTGEFDWVVESIQVLEREERPPQLVADVEEVGTDLPTKIDSEAPARLRALSTRDPSFDWMTFQQRVALIFSELQQAWSSQQWKQVRPFVSDGLFQTQLYWIQTYQRSKLRNITENARIAQIVCASVLSDKYFDAITIRLYASSLDYTVSAESGQVLCGSKTKPRKYSEYWTLIRSVERKGATTTGKQCPNCGAELNVNMAGNCEFCKAKVTSGEFDWVLSRIEQDESYEG